MCLPLGSHVLKADMDKKTLTITYAPQVCLALPSSLATFRLCLRLSSPMFSASSLALLHLMYLSLTIRAKRASSQFFELITLPENLGPCHDLYLEHSTLPLSVLRTSWRGLPSPSLQSRPPTLPPVPSSFPFQHQPKFEITRSLGDLFTWVSPTTL